MYDNKYLINNLELYISNIISVPNDLCNFSNNSACKQYVIYILIKNVL